MNQFLTANQIADLGTIRNICDELDAEVVIIGATALLLSIGDIGRFTRDVDLTVALDLDGFAQLTDRLTSAGWKQAPTLEHRWFAPGQTIVDLLPAGPALRRRGSMVWPVSQFTMSLSGFDHVFTSAVEVVLAEETRIRVSPAKVTALLKMIAYVEDPYRRSKDLQDLQVILGRYEAHSERLFSDEVFDAQLADFSEVNGFLLGLDLRALAKGEELKYIETFLERSLRTDDGDPGDSDSTARTFHERLHAFKKGFERQ